MGDLSPHFSRHEFDCHDGTAVPPDMMVDLTLFVLSVLEPIRAAVLASFPTPPSDFRCDVLSGFRTPTHNAAEGGATNSYHLKARAADIRFLVYDTADSKLWLFVRRLWKAGKLPALGGLGRYDNRIHVDNRPHAIGVLAEWDFRSKKGTP